MDALYCNFWTRLFLNLMTLPLRVAFVFIPPFYLIIQVKFPFDWCMLFSFDCILDYVPMHHIFALGKVPLQNSGVLLYHSLLVVCHATLSFRLHYLWQAPQNQVFAAETVYRTTSWNVTCTGSWGSALRRAPCHHLHHPCHSPFLWIYFSLY